MRTRRRAAHNKEVVFLYRDAILGTARCSWYVFSVAIVTTAYENYGKCYEAMDATCSGESVYVISLLLQEPSIIFDNQKSIRVYFNTGVSI